MSRKKPEIYQTFLASLKGGGYPQFGKRPNYFRFFLVKASLRQEYKVPGTRTGHPGTRAEPANNSCRGPKKGGEGPVQSLM